MQIKLVIYLKFPVVVFIFAATLLANAQAEPICTIIIDGKSGQELEKKGDCDTRVTPASTYKIALSLMGFDSGFLVNSHEPVLDYKAGDPDWGGVAWLTPTDPARWIKYSVVWFSQRVTQQLGIEKIEAYTKTFNFGNADMSGDAGKANGLDRAWISSSLKISPREQVNFLANLVNFRLPVSHQAVGMTANITTIQQSPGEWEIHGKTGTAFPRDTLGNSDESRGYGWFVGWATKGERILVFARLTQDSEANKVPAGLRTRESLLRDWSVLTEQNVSASQ